MVAFRRGAGEEGPWFAELNAKVEEGRRGLSLGKGVEGPWRPGSGYG